MARIEGAPTSWKRACNQTLEHPSTHNCSIPYKLEYYSGLVVPINGLVTPGVIIVTIATNFLVCLVLVKPHMRSPTNALLVAMAISDTLTGACPLPCFLYFYTMGHHVDYVPYFWCSTYVYLIDYMPTIFHTASIWLTVSLAVHRYIAVCHPARAAAWCSGRSVAGIVVTTYLLATASQLSRFFEDFYEPVHLDSRPHSPGCAIVHSPLVRRHINLYYNIYYWSRVIFIHLLPCLLLIVMNVILIQTMRTAQARRKLLLAQHRKSESRSLKESNLKTLMLVTVVGVFLLVEFPLAVFLILIIVKNSFGVEILRERTQRIASLLINLFIVLSYPINFFIYCGMSRQFRLIFKQLFSCKKGQTSTKFGSSTNPADGSRFRAIQNN